MFPSLLKFFAGHVMFERYRVQYDVSNTTWLRTAWQSGFIFCLSLLDRFRYHIYNIRKYFIYLLPQICYRLLMFLLRDEFPSILFVRIPIAVCLKSRIFQYSVSSFIFICPRGVFTGHHQNFILMAVQAEEDEEKFWKFDIGGATIWEFYLCLSTRIKRICLWAGFRRVECGAHIVMAWIVAPSNLYRFRNFLQILFYN